MTKRERQLPVRSGAKDVDDFLQKVALTPVTKAAGSRGRLMFAIDATASREPTWDMACHLQSEMFEETAALGKPPRRKGKVSFSSPPQSKFIA